MTNVTAMHVLLSLLPDIKEGHYRTATEIAIEALIDDAKIEWERHYSDKVFLSEYLGLSEDQYNYWVNGERGDHSEVECNQL